MQYQFKDGEELKSPTERIIEKRGHVITFSLNDVTENNRINEKNKREFEGQKMIEDAKVVNITSFHKKIAKLSDEDLFAAHMLYEAKRVSKMCDEKIKEIDAQLKSDADEVEEIKKQIPELVEQDVTPNETNESEED